MRIETRLHDDEPAALTLRALSPRDRGTAIRLLIRRNHHELPGLIGLVPATNTAVSPPPSPVPVETPAPRETTTDDAVPLVDKRQILQENVRKVIAQAKAWQKAVVVVGFLLAGIGGLGASAPAQAAGVTLDLNLVSIHGEQWARRDLNQFNPGVGFTYQMGEEAESWAFSVGAYDNSFRRMTAYALAEWTPIRLVSPRGWHLEAGLGGGLASGYRRSEVPCAPAMGSALLRLKSPAGVGVTIFAVPNSGARSSGFVGLQLSIPLQRLPAHA